MRAGREPYRILANCAVGLGFSRRGFAAGLSRRPDLIGCDAGSADFGPAPLGSGADAKPRAAVVRDLELMVLGAAEAGAPLVLGSCGGAGDDPHLERYVDHVETICRANGLRRRTAVIHARQSAPTVKQAIAEGRVSPLGAVPELTPEEVDRSSALVAMMGVGPVEEAIAAGADIVLAGRITDPSIFAAGPLRAGLSPGVSWHAAKSVDKGYLACTAPSEGSPVIAELDEEGFTLTPAKPSSRCSVRSVARLTLHENPDPFRVVQPGGTIDTSGCRYEQLADARSVRVRGSSFVPAERATVKLEGARRAGHRKVAIAGLRDPRLLVELDHFLAEFDERLRASVAALGLPASAWRLSFRQYGHNAVLGDLEPRLDETPREVGLVIDVVAETSDIAAAVLGRAGPIGSRLDLFGGLDGGGNFAYPFSPNVLDGGEVFEWNVWHVMEVEDERSPFAIEYLDAGSRA